MPHSFFFRVTNYFAMIKLKRKKKAKKGKKKAANGLFQHQKRKTPKTLPFQHTSHEIKPDSIQFE